MHCKLNNAFNIFVQKFTNHYQDTFNLYVDRKLFHYLYLP